MMIAPKEPSGLGAIANYLRQLVRFLRSCHLQPGRGYKVKRTIDGTHIELE